MDIKIAKKHDGIHFYNSNPIKPRNVSKDTRRKKVEKHPPLD